MVIGVLVSRSIRTEDDYLLAGRQLGPTVATFSIFATWFGAETCVGSAGAVYADRAVGHPRRSVRLRPGHRHPRGRVRRAVVARADHHARRPLPPPVLATRRAGRRGADDSHLDTLGRRADPGLRPGPGLRLRRHVGQRRDCPGNRDGAGLHDLRRVARRCLDRPAAGHRAGGRPDRRVAARRQRAWRDWPGLRAGRGVTLGVAGAGRDHHRGAESLGDSDSRLGHRPGADLAHRRLPLAAGGAAGGVDGFGDLPVDWRAAGGARADGHAGEPGRRRRRARAAGPGATPPADVWLRAVCRRAGVGHPVHGQQLSAGGRVDDLPQPGRAAPARDHRPRQAACRTRGRDGVGRGGLVSRAVVGVGARAGRGGQRVWQRRDSRADAVCAVEPVWRRDWRRLPR